MVVDTDVAVCVLVGQLEGKKFQKRALTSKQAPCANRGTFVIGARRRKENFGEFKHGKIYIHCPDSKMSLDTISIIANEGMTFALIMVLTR